MAKYYYQPVWAAQLTVGSAGRRATRISEENDDSSTVSIELKVAKFEHEVNDHTHADRLSLTCDWQTVGIDPRLIRNGTVSFFLDDTDGGFFVPDEKNCRFIGQVTEVERSSAEDEPYTVRIDALDYTDFFLRAKNFGTSGIPDYSQTLDDAWRRVVSQTPGAERLADRIFLYGLDSFPQLGSAVSARFAKLARVPTKPNTDAWAVWQQCVGMMGLISFFDRDQLIVTTAEEYYKTSDPPVLIYGQNIAEMTESRDLVTFSRGVGISSFDPTTHQTIEGQWPAKALAKSKRKRVKAVPINTPNEAEFVQDYDWYAFPGVSQPEVAQQIARRAWEERSRQELQGTVITSFMQTETASGAPFDLLSLHAGDNIQIAVNDNVRDALLRLDTVAVRTQYLKDQGYQADAAQLIAQNVDDLALLDDTFYVKSVRTKGRSEKDGGEFDVSVAYCNRILVSGDSAESGSGEED